ncbi:general stress protein [Peribacillus sp. SCS-155]|uniref:general stress protein n=1 Tax=Peribacillus sedimenti TaxID=3115297 RepID=UPI0039058D98
MTKRVIGLYETETEALKAVKDLQSQGYSIEEISVIAKNIDGLGPNADKVAPRDQDGIVAGAAVGGAIGLAGLFLGISALAIPGVGPILAAGPIFSTLGGAVAGAATNAGGLVGALKDMGLEDEEARQYESDVTNGKILVMVSK